MSDKQDERVSAAYDSGRASAFEDAREVIAAAMESRARQNKAVNNDPIQPLLISGYQALLEVVIEQTRIEGKVAALDTIAKVEAKFLEVHDL